MVGGVGAADPADPAPDCGGSEVSMDDPSPLKLLRLHVGEMFGVGCMIWMSMTALASLAAGAAALAPLPTPR